MIHELNAVLDFRPFLLFGQWLHNSENWEIPGYVPGTLRVKEKKCHVVMHSDTTKLQICTVKINE